jgi:hypothetical protein
VCTVQPQRVLLLVCYTMHCKGDLLLSISIMRGKATPNNRLACFIQIPQHSSNIINVF